MERFELATTLPVSAETAFAWHARPGALPRLMPPWERVEVVRRTGGLEPGARVALRMRTGPLWQRWDAVHGEMVAGRSFTDRQERGPFAQWEHRHAFEPLGPDACRMVDDVRYELPLAPLSQWFAGGMVRRRLAQMFAYRHATVRADLAAVAGDRPRRILVSGASGLVGRALVPFLTAAGHEVVRLVRTPAPAPAGTLAWDPQRPLAPEEVAGFDAVVHLAGAGIADGRWSAARKAEILASRVDGTRTLASALAACKAPPRAFVCASATGFYGDRGEQVLDEAAAPGDGFLPDVSKAWEAAAEPARAAGLRVAHMRIGIVLDPRGGALGKMLPLFKLGLAGRLGSGTQFMSWIALDDLVAVLHRAIVDERVRGAVNAVTAGAVTNAAFTATLARVLRRPAFLPAPAFALRLALGEMAQPLLLASTRVAPGALQALGHGFRHPELEGALRHVLGRRLLSATTSPDR